MPATSVNPALRYLRTLFAGKAEGQSDQHLLEKSSPSATNRRLPLCCNATGPWPWERACVFCAMSTWRKTRCRQPFWCWPSKRCDPQARLPGRLALRCRARPGPQGQGRGLPAPGSPWNAKLPDSRRRRRWRRAVREEKELLDDNSNACRTNTGCRCCCATSKGSRGKKIAAQLGLTEGQVRGLLDRGRERLRSRLIRCGCAFYSGRGAERIGRGSHGGARTSIRAHDSGRGETHVRKDAS